MRRDPEPATTILQASKLHLAAQLAQDDDHLDLRDVLIPETVVRQRGAREHIAANCDACVASGLASAVELSFAVSRAVLQQALKARLWSVCDSICAKSSREAPCRSPS